MARAAYMAMALSRTLAFDSAGLLREAAGAAAAVAPLSTDAVPFAPAAARHPTASAGASEALYESLQSEELGSDSSSGLDSPGGERETEAAVAPYIAAVSPPRCAPLPPIAEGLEMPEQRRPPAMAPLEARGRHSGGAAAAGAGWAEPAAAATPAGRPGGAVETAAAASQEAGPMRWHEPVKPPHPEAQARVMQVSSDTSVASKVRCEHLLSGLHL